MGAFFDNPALCLLGTWTSLEWSRASDARERWFKSSRPDSLWKGKPSGDGIRPEPGRALSLEGSTPSPSALTLSPSVSEGPSLTLGARVGSQTARWWNGRHAALRRPCPPGVRVQIPPWLLHSGVV